MFPDTNPQDRHNPRISRREFFRPAASLVLASPFLAAGRPVLPQAAKRSICAYVGTYSSPQGPAGNGKGIYLFEMDTATGALKQREVFANDSNPAWLAFDPSRTHLYSANEIDGYQGANTGSVGAYAVDRKSGRLTFLNTVSSHGAGPTHLSVHPSGKYVLVANYEGGSVAVLPVRPGGGLGEATDVKELKGVLGPARAAGAPPGSFAISGHDRPHAHMIQADPAGNYVLASDLGLDRIFIWRFDAAAGSLMQNEQASVALPPGDGPRHFIFHPNGHWLYSLQEESSNLVVYDYDGMRGKLTAKQTISTLPKGFAGTSFTSEVVASPDGRFVYAANRLHDSIACFSVGTDGTLKAVGEEWTRGDYPRSINIDPTGDFLYSCNQKGDAITTFKRNRETGRLAFTGQYTPVGTPAMIIFLS